MEKPKRYVLPKFIGLSRIFKSRLVESPDKIFFADIQVIAKCVQRRIKVPELHVHEAQEHGWVFGKFH